MLNYRVGWPVRPGFAVVFIDDDLVHIGATTFSDLLLVDDGKDVIAFQTRPHVVLESDGAELPLFFAEGLV